MFYKHPPLTKVLKSGRAGLVLGWVTAWEYPVSQAPFFLWGTISAKNQSWVSIFSVSKPNNIHLLYSNIDPRVHQLSKVPTCKVDFVLCDVLSSHGRISSTPLWAGFVAIYDKRRTIPFWPPCEGNPTELCISFQCFTVVNMNTASKKKKTAHSRMNPYFRFPYSVFRIPFPVLQTPGEVGRAICLAGSRSTRSHVDC